MFNFFKNKLVTSLVLKREQWLIYSPYCASF